MQAGMGRQFVPSAEMLREGIFLVRDSAVAPQTRPPIESPVVTMSRVSHCRALPLGRPIFRLRNLIPTCAVEELRAGARWARVGFYKGTGTIGLS